MRLLFFVTLTCAAVSGQVLSSGYIRVDLNLEPGNTAPLSGDFTGDGVPDLLVHTPTEVRVYPGRGNGQASFGAAIRTPLAVAEPRTLPHAAAAADFNVDGKLDLFAFGRIFLGNGDGTLRFSTDVVVQDQPQVIDYDKDGAPDLFGRREVGTYALIRGTGDGRFPGVYGDPEVEYSHNHVAAMADVDGDGGLDVITGGGTSQGREVDLFTVWPHGITFFGVLGNSMRVADFTGDGIPDILTNASLTTRGVGMALFTGRGGGRFAPAIAVAGSCGFGPDCQYTDFATADLDQDGKLDLAMLLTSSTGGRHLVVSQGSAAGTFSSAWASLNQSSAGLKYVSLGDWNGDGQPDLAVDDGTSVVLLMRAPVAPNFAVSSASGNRNVSPGSLVTLYGTGLAGETATTASLSGLPTRLGGVELRVEKLASYFEDYAVELLYVAPTQINFRLPSDQPISETDSGQLYLVDSSGKRFVGLISLQARAPGLFTVDGTRAVGTVENGASGLLLTLYATGLRAPSSGVNVRLVIGNQSFVPATVQPSPDVMGLDVIRVLVPRQGCLNAACSSVEIREASLTVEFRGATNTSNVVTVSGEVR